MRKNKMVYFTLWAFLFCIVIFCSVGCLSEKFTIEGKYNAESGKSLSDLDLKLTLQDENKEVFEYEVNLDEDGSFKVRVKEEGVFIGYFSLLNYSREKWVDPFISNLSEYYRINTSDGKSAILENLYIADLKEIKNPKNDDQIEITEDFTISWENDPFASFYHLMIIKKKETENEPTVYLNAFQLTTNSIGFRELLSLPREISNLSFDEWSRKNTFVRKEGELIPGSYTIAVNGYILDTEQDRYIYTSESEKISFQLLEM